MSNLRRKHNLLADRCAIFEANANSDESGSFLTNFASRRTKDAFKDHSTQATMDISETSSTTVGSGNLSAPAQRSSPIETMDAIGEDSISDNMYEHLGPPIHITQKRTLFLTGMNVSDVTFEPFSPQVSSSNMFQNSLEFKHQPLTEASARDKLNTLPSKRRSDLIAYRASLFEGCISPPPGFIFSQSKSQDPSSPKCVQQIQHGVASVRISERRDFFSAKKCEQETWRTLDKKDDFQQSVCDFGHKLRNVITNADNSIVQRPQRTPKKEKVAAGSKALSEALESHPNSEIRQLRSNVKAEADSESHNASMNLALRRTSVRRDIESTILSDGRSPTTPQRECLKGTEKILQSPRQTIHNCTPIIQKSGRTGVSQASPRLKAPEKRKAMLKKLLKIKRSPVTKAV